MTADLLAQLFVVVMLTAIVVVLIVYFVLSRREAKGATTQSSDPVSKSPLKPLKRSEASAHLDWVRMTPEVSNPSSVVSPVPLPDTRTLAERAKENDGLVAERRLDDLLKRKLSPKYYRVLHDIILPNPSGNGTTQIDHIVISQSCIFVIETKDWGGFVFGRDADDGDWTVCYSDKSRARFHNPVSQNQMHIVALSKCLRRPLSDFRSIVAFTQRSHLAYEHSDGVVLLWHVPAFIRWRSVGKLYPLEVLPCIEKSILDCQDAIPEEVRANHAERCRERLSRKRESDSSPKDYR